jgi:hypothetical protein
VVDTGGGVTVSLSQLAFDARSDRSDSDSLICSMVDAIKAVAAANC